MNSHLLMVAFTPLLLIDYGHRVGWTFFSRGVVVVMAVICVEHFGAHVPHAKISTLFTHPRYTVFMSAEGKAKLQGRLADLDSLGQHGHNYFYGMDSHMIMALTEEPWLWNGRFWQRPDDEVDITAITAAFRRDPRAVLFDYTDSPLLRRHITSALPGRVTICAGSFTTVYRHRPSAKCAERE